MFSISTFNTVGKFRIKHYTANKSKLYANNFKVIAKYATALHAGLKE